MRIYTAKENDTPETVAGAGGVSVKTLLHDHCLSPGEKLLPGMTFYLSCPARLIFPGRGETLASVARDLDLPLSALLRRNPRVKATSPLRAGVPIRIPAAEAKEAQMSVMGVVSPGFHGSSLTEVSPYLTYLAFPGGWIRDTSCYLSRAPRGSGSPVPLALPEVHASFLPETDPILSALKKSGFRGLILPVEDLPTSAVAEGVPRLSEALHRAGLLFFLSTEEEDLFKRERLFRACGNEVDGIRCRFPEDKPFALSLERIGDTFSRTTQRKLLPDLPFRARDARWDPPRLSDRRDAISLAIKNRAVLRRDEWVIYAFPSGGAVTCEDPGSLRLACERLCRTAIGGVTLHPGKTYPWEYRMLDELFVLTGGGTDAGRFLP